MDISETLSTATDPVQALAGIPEPLLEWFGKHARYMPWRENPQPYWVWVSEIMLQQTRVEAVRAYFDRFLQALPTIADLAQAPEEALLKLWEGLGYYSRVRNLQKAAKVVCDRHGGELPASFEALQTLPGIGEYTAGAIASIAFGIPVPAVDGNVHRVFSRLLASYADVTKPGVKKAHKLLAAAIVPARRPGDFNQALMELGATVCLPNSPPQCLLCPVQGFCAGYGQGCAGQLPVKTAKKQRRLEQRTIIVVTDGERTLLWQRGSKGLLSGMYEPLNLPGHLDALQAQKAVEDLGGHIGRIVPLPDAKHIFTHVEWQMKGYLAHTPPFDGGGGIWAGQEELEKRYAVPGAFKAFRKYLFMEGDL